MPRPNSRTSTASCSISRNMTGPKHADPTAAEAMQAAAARWSAAELRALVTPDSVNRALYVDPDIFELELDRIFGRAWLYVAHESQIKGSGDFVRTRLGRRDVIVVRGEDGAIHVLHNRCAHRGARICTAERGNARFFMCPYHEIGR